MNCLIVIIARNNLALTKLAVRSALSQQPPCDVLCVDNASTDGTSDWLKTKNVARISYQKQLSLAACWNAALRAAWKCGYDSALVLNNDVVIRPDTVRLLTEHGGEFVTCVSVDSEERLGTPGDRTIEVLRAGEREHPDFSAFVIRKSVTDRGLWFDEECWPAYTEDAFAHIAMWRAGVRSVCIDLPFVHWAASTLKEANEREAIIIRRGADANRARFRKKYGCAIGSPKYYAMFSKENFGIDSTSSARKAPAKHPQLADDPLRLAGHSLPLGSQPQTA